MRFLAEELQQLMSCASVVVRLVYATARVTVMSLPASEPWEKNLNYWRPGTDSPGSHSSSITRQGAIQVKAQRARHRGVCAAWQLVQITRP